MNSIFCSKCGMIKSRCVCSNRDEKQNSTIERPSVDEKKLLQEQNPDIDDEIIENFPFKTARNNIRNYGSI